LLVYFAIHVFQFSNDDAINVKIACSLGNLYAMSEKIGLVKCHNVGKIERGAGVLNIVIVICTVHHILTYWKLQRIIQTFIFK